jgi:ABC-type glycerol-3-phosphate transport system permease component
VFACPDVRQRYPAARCSPAPPRSTAPVAIVNFMQYAGFEWGKIAAGGVSVMLPVLLFTVLVRRYLVSGLTAGGVKE